MKSNNVAAADYCLEPLSADEMQMVNGGSFWGDLAYAVGVTLKSYVVFCSTASSYQASLPPSLKK